ncbi:9923_t:CDS:2, partial [Cetraspora pellucida]
MLDLQSKKADITYAQLFQVASGVQKEALKILCPERIIKSKFNEFCLGRNNEFYTTSMYCEANVNREPIILILDSGSSGCVVMIKKARAQLDWKTCELTIRDGNKKIKVPTEYCKPTNIADHVQKEAMIQSLKTSKNDRKSNKSNDNEYKSSKESGKSEADSDEYKNEEILENYQDLFAKELHELEKTTVVQHEIHTDEGLSKTKEFASTKEVFETCRVLPKEKEQERAFDELKVRLTTVLILVHSRDNREFLLNTNTSHVALGAILAQFDNKRREHVIEYA